MREKGAQWLVTLCASVVHEWDKCATTILAFEVYLVRIRRDFLGDPRDLFPQFWGYFGHF